MSGRLRFLRTPTGIAGFALVALVAAVALIGPFFSPYAPDKPIGAPLTGPGVGAMLGTDFLGRDVLSRVLWGGRSVLGLAGLATLIGYIGGTVIGLVAGYARSVVDGLLMRATDVMLSAPPLLFLLVLVTGTGTSKTTLVIGVALVQLPLVARIVRAATLEQSVRGFVEAAEARGEHAPAILRREILPNILPAIMADIGLRFTYSIILVASVNFLGLGLQPPASDWALIINENRTGLTLNPLTILVPALMIALLTIGVNLMADAIARSLGRSSVKGVRG
jgi:peptide/nickel transport system permease protein